MIILATAHRKAAWAHNLGHFSHTRAGHIAFIVAVIVLALLFLSSRARSS